MNQHASFFQDPFVTLIDELQRLGKSQQVTSHQLHDAQTLTGRTFELNGKEVINFGNCGYFGLETDPRLKQGVVDAVNQYGTNFLMSRSYAAGPLLATFEAQLHQLFEAFPVVFPSTTLGSASFMSVFPEKGDVVLLDKHVHNSVRMSAAVAGARGARVMTVKHNDMQALEDKVRKLTAEPGTGRIWYCADGIYSMSGSTVPVEALRALLDAHDNLYAYVDDAHGMSFMGKHGRGFVLSHGPQHPKMVVALSLSKCFGMGCGGVLVLPHAEWQGTLRNCAPSIIFSTPVPPPMLGAGVASAKIHLSDEVTELQDKLLTRIRYFKMRAEEMGLTLGSADLTPVQFVRVGHTHKAIAAAKAMIAGGFFVNTAGYPAVPMEEGGVRLTISNHLTLEDIDNVTLALRTVVAG